MSEMLSITKLIKHGQESFWWSPCWNCYFFEVASTIMCLVTDELYIALILKRGYENIKKLAQTIHQLTLFFTENKSFLLR